MRLSPGNRATTLVAPSCANFGSARFVVDATLNNARKAFAEAQRAAYADFCRRVDAGEDTAIDPYAAEHIDEFFAVSCEVFFAEPELLREEYPAYFGQLEQWFRVDTVRGEIVKAAAAL